MKALLLLTAPFLALALPSTDGGRSPFQDPAVARTPIEERMDYFLRGGGVWVAANEDRQRGDEQPEAFVYRFAWGLGKQIVHIRILGRFAGGKTAQYWETICAWDPIEKKIVIHQFGWDGTILLGEERREKDTIVHELKGHRGDGSPMHFRDESVVLDADSFRSTTFFPDGEDWKKVQSMTWRRAQ